MKKIKFVSKKIVIFFLCLCSLTGTWVKATQVPEGTYVSVYANKRYEQITYKGNTLKIPIAQYYYSKNAFPIYSLTQEKYYVDKNIGFSTKINEILKNERIRQILLNGYPNCSYEQLNCSNKEEAYIVTQIAIFDVYYNYDLTKFSVKKGNEYPNIISNIISFIEKMRNLDVKETSVDITIDQKESKWNKEDNEYESKTYRILSNNKVNNFTVEIRTEDEEDENEIQITNKSNETQKSFNNVEEFKILVPKDKQIEFEIIVTAQAETKPIRKAKKVSEKWEDYIFLGETEEIKTNLIDVHYKLEEVDDNKKLEQQEGQNDEKKETESTTNILHFSKKQKIKKLPQTGF